MKNIVTILSFLLISIILIPQAQAQIFSIPSRQMVERLLGEIEECKEQLVDLEAELVDIKNNPGNYTYQDYLLTREIIQTGKDCVAFNRKKLDNLRKNYPEWFTDPQATIDLGRGHSVTPKQLKKKVKDNERFFADLLARFNAIPVPERD